MYAGTNNSVTGGEIWKTISAGDPPDKPTLSLPVNNATGVSLTPTLQTENFSDPDSGDTHSQTQWQISTVDDFSTDLLNVTRTSHLTSLTVPHQTLNEGTIYYWRVRFYDNDSNASEWSDAFSFTTLTTTNDQNANGIPDNQENETVDLDNDGTADIVQDDIKSLNTVVGDGQMGVSRKDEPNITSIESIESIDPDTISQTAIPYSIPLGLFTMNLNVANAGDSVQATVYFSEAAPVNGRWFKYDSINGWQNYSEYATFSSDRKSVILELRDGGHGDADGVANGVIVDPGGFGLASWIEGYVSDVSTGQAIKSAVISILNLTMTTMSDGHYLSMILPGTYSCSVSASGYQTINKTIEVSEGSILNYNFKMAAVGSGGDSSGGSVNVYFPHIAGDGTWETEICVVNTSSQQNLSGEFTAYSHSGQKVDSTSVFLSPKGRRSIVVGDEFSSASNIGYIIFESDSQNLRGYLKFYINGKYRVAIPAASDVNTGDIYISHIASDDNWTTGISILNTTSASKDLPIEFDNGMTKTLTIAANEHKAFTISGLFDGQPQPGINSAVIKNGNGIVGLEIFGTTESSGLSYLSGILLKDDTTSTIYYPHIASDETWSTGVVAYNPSDTSCELAITPYSVNGTPLSPQMLSIDGKRKYIGTVDGLDLPDGTAWFSIEAASPITGFELFSTKDGNQLGGYTGVGISGKDGVFAKIDKEGTGIAFVNIEDFSATVTMTAYDDSGNVIATETVNLIDHEKKVDVPSSLFSEDISTATYIAYSSTGNVVGFQLNVSADGMMLDALPGM